MGEIVGNLPDELEASLFDFPGVRGEVVEGDWMEEILEEPIDFLLAFDKAGGVPPAFLLSPLYFSFLPCP